MNALQPITRRLDLPAIPLTVADVPPGTVIHRGRLEAYTITGKRPVVGIRIACAECGASHRFPIRWDWGLSTEFVTYQALPCRRRSLAVWIALDPAHAEAAATVHADAHNAFVAWTEMRVGFKAAREAARAAAKASTTVEPPSDPPTPPAAVTPSEKPSSPTSSPRPSTGLSARLANRRPATPIVTRNPWEAPTR